MFFPKIVIPPLPGDISSLSYLVDTICRDFGISATGLDTFLRNGSKKLECFNFKLQILAIC